MDVIYPPEKKLEIDNKLIFLAGPIQGAIDWQAKICYTLNDYKNNNITIANPRRSYINDNFNYDKQVNWETYYLNKADIIIFWLANETTKIDGRQYAQTTRIELGEQLGKQKYDRKTKIILGIDDNFPSGRYIRIRIKNDYPWININNNFHDLIESAKDAIDTIL